MDWKKVQKLVETINTYYAFALLMYVAALYVASHNQVFWWILLAATPIIAGWTGYLLHSFLQRRNQRYGFRVISDVMSYEMFSGRKYRLHYNTTIKADADHLFTYPFGYQWSGKGEESLPRLQHAGQKLMAVVDKNVKGDTLSAAPYAENVTSEGEWRYWLVGLATPAYKGDIVQIKYVQDFADTKGTAKPYLYYCVRTPMKRLELNIKFAGDELPRSVTCGYSKPSDLRRTYPAKGVMYDPDKQWATWIIYNPKKGYCYRIQWA
jgi:hypothetical protein